MYNTVQYTVQYNYIIPDSGEIWQVALVGLNIMHFIFLYVYYKNIQNIFNHGFKLYVQ
jgi:hypothetical protein